MESQDSMEQQGNIQPDAAPGVAVGAALRAARESMGMSVEEVAGRLKFAPRQITALENGDLDQLPEVAFIRGFVRSYARLVQLDEKPLLDALPGAPAPAAVQVRAATTGEVPRRNAERRQQNLFWLGGALLIAVVGVLAWKYDAGEAVPKGAGNSKPAASSSPAEATQTADAQPAATAGSPEPAQSAGTAPAVQPAETGVPSPQVAPAAGAAQEAGQGVQNAQLSQPAQPAPHAPASANTGAGGRSLMTATASAPKSPASGVAANGLHARPKVASSAVTAGGVSGVAASGVAATGERPARAQRGGHLVRLEFEQDSWVEVTDGTGRLLLSMLGKQGTSQNVAGPAPLSVVVGNARGVKLFYKGEAVPLEPMKGSDVARLKLE